MLLDLKVCRFGKSRNIGRARGLARMGDVAGSRAAYEDFFAAWKDADPDVPILVAAKQESARLK